LEEGAENMTRMVQWRNPTEAARWDIWINTSQWFSHILSVSTT